MINRVIKWFVFKCIYPFWYFIHAGKKIDNRKILFVENHQDTLSDNFKLLYEELEHRGYELHVHYLKVAGSKWKNIIVRSLGMLADMATANCVFISESNSVFGAFKLREETKLVQLWHACGAFKKWGFSVADHSFGDDRKELLMYSGHRNYSLVPVSGEAVCWAYEEAFGLQDKGGIVKALGVSRTDVYFDMEAKRQAERKLSQLKISINNRKIVLYAPTFRGDIKNAEAPDKFDMAVFYDRFHKDYVLLIKQHPFVKKNMVISSDLCDSIIEITDEMTIDELLITADICITDYSSIVFEYSLMDKPILFFAFDLEEYYDERGFYYPYEEFVPGNIAMDMKELIQCIENIDVYDYGKLKAFKKKYMSGCDGHSTERILAEIF